MPAITSSRIVQKAEAKYNVTTEYPNYGLHSAAATGNLGLVSFALTNGQPTNAVLDGVLPIHAAASGGNTRVVRMLIDAGADLNIGRLSRKLGAGGGKGRSGVSAGASGGGVNLCTTSGGSHIGTGGSTALHFAAANGHVDVLTLLLRCGADLNRADKHGVTPLMLAESLGQTGATATLRAWASANPSSQQSTSTSANPSGVHSLKVKHSLEALLRRPWGGSRIDISRPDLNASRIDLGTGGDGRGDLDSGSSIVDLGSGSSQTELGGLGFLPPFGTSYNGESRRPSLPSSAGLLFGARPHRPRSDRTSWSGGRMRKFFSRAKREESASWDAGESTRTIDWAEEVEFRRGEKVAVEMGLKAPSAALLARRVPSQNKKTIRLRRKASEFHPDPEHDYDFLDDDLPLPRDRSALQDDDGDMDDDDLDMAPPKRVLHPRSFSHTGTGFSRSGMGRLTSPSMPILPLPNGPSLMSSAATSTTSIIPVATSPQHTPARSHAPSPSGPPAHVRSTSGSSITRRGLRASSSFSSFLPRQPEEPMASSGESTVAGSALVAVGSSFHPQEPANAQDPGSLLQPPDSRFRGDSLSSTSSENTNQLSSSMATTDTGMTTPSLYAATPLPPHKGAMTFSPVFEAEDLDEVEEPEEEDIGELSRDSISPISLRTVSTFAQAQNLVRQVEREILELGPQGPDSPSLAEQLAAYGESLAIERRFARGEAQRQAWQAERKSQDDDGAGDDDDDDEEGGWAGYTRDQMGPRIAAPLGRTASVDYQTGGKFRTIRPPSRTHSVPIRQIPSAPLSPTLVPPFSPVSRTPERSSSSFSGTLPHSHSRQTSITRAALIPRRTASSHSSYVSRPSSIEIIETAATPIESPPYRSLDLHRRSASTGVSGFPWAYAGFGALSVSQSPEQSDDADSHYELNSRTAPLSRITTAPSKIGNAIGNAFSRDPDYEPVRRRKLKRLVKQLVNAERSGTDKEATVA